MSGTGAPARGRNGEEPLGVGICRALADRGVDTVFGIPGVHNQELYRGIGSAGIRHVLARHEQGAGFMADGYARASGRPGVAFVISGPGVTNILTPVAQAHSDSVPMLVIAACLGGEAEASPRERLHQLKCQSETAGSVADWCATARGIDEFCEAADRAFDEFATKRKRPKFIQVPVEALARPAPPPPAPKAPGALPKPPRDQVARTVGMIKASKRIVLVLGGGARAAAGPARRVLDLAGAAAFTTYAGKGTIPGSHPRSFGAFLARPESAAVFSTADLVVAAGTGLSEVDLWRDRLGHSCPMIRVDVDDAQLSACGSGDLPVLGDAKAFFELVGEALEGFQREPGWTVGEVRDAKERMRASCEAERPDVPEAARAFREALPEGAIVYSDMTQFAYAAKEILDIDPPSRWHHPYGFGTLGYALPAAIGGKVAAPGAPVAAAAGDYGIQYTLQELGAASELGAPLPILVWDNAGLREIDDSMARDGIPADALACANPDFELVARAYGLEYCAAASPDELAADMRRAFAAARPTLIRVRAEGFA